MNRMITVTNFPEH